MQWHQLDDMRTICRQITTPTPHHSIFMGSMFFLMRNQQCQSNEENIYNISTRCRPSVLWSCWLGDRKGIRPVKNCTRRIRFSSGSVILNLSAWAVGAGMVICLEQGADYIWPSWYHCYSLSLASVKSRLVYLSGSGLPGSPGKRAVKRVCVCVCISTCCRTWLQNHKLSVRKLNSGAVSFLLHKHLIKYAAWNTLSRDYLQ